jgi:cytochrome c oxidase subunit 2
VIGMALLPTKTVVAMKAHQQRRSDVKVTGYQWKWGYEYLDGPSHGRENTCPNLSTPRAQIEGRETPLAQLSDG